MIAEKILSSKDGGFYNIEFLIVFINNFPQICMITSKYSNWTTIIGNLQIKAEPGYNRRVNQLEHRLYSQQPQLFSS